MKNEVFLLRELVRRDFQARYAGSIFGFVWSFAQPLWQLLLFTFVFSWILKIPLEGELTDSFGLFVFSGLLPWLAVQEGVTRATTAIVDNATVVKKSRLSLRVLVLAPVASALVHEAIALAMFVVVLAVGGNLGFYSLPLLIPALICQIALTAGLGLLLCSVHTYFRDTSQLLQMAMTGWFYFTPIVYGQRLQPDQLVPFALFNPLQTLVALYRQALLGDALVWVPGLGHLVAVAGVVLLAGATVFRRLEHLFVDEI